MCRGRRDLSAAAQVAFVRGHALKTLPDQAVANRFRLGTQTASGMISYSSTRPQVVSTIWYLPGVVPVGFSMRTLMRACRSSSPWSYAMRTSSGEA